MPRSLMVVANKMGAGKTSVCFGLLDQLERHGVRACYFKPVGLVTEPDRPGRDANLILRATGAQISSERLIATDSAAVAGFIKEGRYDDIMDEILERHGELAADFDLIVCEGVDSIRAFPALDTDINIDIAKNIDAALILVVDAEELTAPEAASDILLVRQELTERGVNLAGVIVNRVAQKRHGMFADDLRHALRESNVCLFGVIPDLPALSMPRVSDVLRQLDARVLLGDDHLETRIGEVVVAAMSLENALHHLTDNCLVITPGDREEILLAAAAAYACDGMARPAGVLLTGGFEPRRRVMQAVRGLSRGRLPVLQVEEATYPAAIAVNRTEAALEEYQEDKLLALRDAVEEYLSLDSLLGAQVDVGERIITPRRFLRDLRTKAKANRQSIVLPESEVDRVLHAAEELRRHDTVDVILIGNEPQVRAHAQQLGVELDDGVTIVDHLQDPALADYIETLVELRKHKDLSREVAADLMRDRTYFATMMVFKGRADGMVSGATTTTQATIRPAFEFVRTRPGINNVSSVFFMCLPDRVLVYADCAVIPNPTVEQLAEIALASAETAAAFGIEPRVAMLSYSTGASGKGADVEKVRAATALIRERNPNLPVDGPLQYDAAVDPAVARTKLPGSDVAGRATVFIFPDLNTGNNTYKAVQRSANAVAIGPILQGLNKPVNDLSRGATIADIVNTVMFTAIQAQAR